MLNNIQHKTRNISLTELREIQLNLLDKVDQFCSKFNLRYSLGGGTLLGAIRHKGFIPWDDDVDIMMPRPDYEFFISNFTSENIELQHLANSADTYIPFTKIFDTRTVLIEHYATNGVFIDLFPIDGLPSEEETVSYYEKQQRLFNNLYNIHDYKTKAYVDYDKSLPKFLVHIKYWFKHMKYLSRDECIHQLNQLYSSFDFESAKYAGAICGAYGMKEHMLKDIFTSYTKVTFENREYSIIENFDAYLRKHYGNYMLLPPVDKQKPSHHFIAFWKD